MAWKALLKIPSGTVGSYSEAVQHFGRLKNACTVRRARGTNRFGQLIPLHRGIHNTVTITGCRWAGGRPQAQHVGLESGQESSKGLNLKRFCTLPAVPA